MTRLTRVDLLAASVLMVLPACAGTSTTSDAVGDEPRSSASTAAESRFAKVGDLRLEYFQFGEEGPPVVFVQDHHDYFRLEEAESWVRFLSRVGEDYRVLAPVRRGWGQSEDPGYGYDIETQAKDILGLLDALGIERAVFAGRTLATHEMLWIAEHHPERILALAFWGTPLLPPPEVEPSAELQRFHQMYSRTSTDIGSGEEIDRRLQRGDWRPSLQSDLGLRIDVPVLLTQHPFFDADGRSWDAPRLDRIERWSEEEQARWRVDPEAFEYVTELRESPERIAALRSEVAAGASNPRIRDAIRRVFGDGLVVVWGRPEVADDRDSMLEEWHRNLSPFLDQVTGDDDEQAVRAAVTRFLRAFNDLDGPTFRECFADDASVFFPLRGHPLRVDGAAAIDEVFGPLFETWRAERDGPPYLSIEPKALAVRMLGSGGALVTFHVGERGRRTLVLIEQEGEWRIVHLHGSASEPIEDEGR